MNVSNKSNKTLKITCMILITFLSILFLFALFAPRFLGTNQILWLANQNIAGKIEASSIHLNTFQDQQIEGLKLYDPDGNLVLSIKEATIPSLFNLFFKNWKSVSVKGLEGNISRRSNGTSNLHNALGIDIGDNHLPPLDIIFSNINADVAPSQLKVVGQFESKGKQGTIQLHVEKEDGDLPKNLKVLDANIKGFPVDLLEQLVSIEDPHLGRTLRVAIGEEFDLKLNKKIENQVIQLQAKSPRSLLNFSGSLTSEGFILADQGRVALQFTPELFQLFPDLKGIELELAKPMAIEAQFDKLKIPFPFNLSQAEMHAQLNIENAFLSNTPQKESITIHDVHASFEKLFNDPFYKVAFKGYVSRQDITSKLDLVLSFDHQLNHITTHGILDPFVIKNLPKGHEITLQDIQFHFETQNLKESQFTVIAHLIPQNNQIISTLLGKSEIKLEGIAKSQGKNIIAIDSLKGSLKSPIAEGEFSGKIDKDQRIVLTTPPHLSYIFTKEVANWLGIGLPIESPSPITVTVNQPKKPIGLNELDQLVLSGQIDIDQLKVGTAFLLNTAIPWEFNVGKGAAQLSIQGQTAISDQTQKGYIQGQIKLHSLKKDNYDYTVDLEASRLPMAFLELYLPQTALDALFGSAFDLALNLSKKGLDVKIHGDQFEGNAHLNIGEYITLQEESDPATFYYTLTPARFEASRKLLNPTSEILLKDTSQIKATITHLKYPWKTSNTSSEIQAFINLDQLRAYDRSINQYIAIENIATSLSSQNTAKQIYFSFLAQQIDQIGQKNDVIIKGEMEDYLTSANHFDLNHLSFKLKGQAQKLPASLICELVCVEKSIRMKMEALLGPVVDTNIDIQLKKMNGPVQVQLAGTSGVVQIDAKIQNGFVTLNQPFVAELKASPQLGQSVLQDMIPILGGLINAENSLQIAIDPQGFSCPVDVKDLEQIQIGSMTVDLGRVHFSNQGQMGKIVSLLKAKPQENITVWFTPIYLSMQAGKINLQRFDMLVMDSFPLATWGSVDFPGDYIDMMIGLSGKSLQNAVGMPALDKNYMMQFPYRGKIGKASVDKTKAAAKIAALTASLTGTPQGLAIGAVIGLASGSLTEEKAPEPTTTPFPWTSQEDESTSNEQAKTSKNPLKSLKKGASNLLNNLFR